MENLEDEYRYLLADENISDLLTDEDIMDIPVPIHFFCDYIPPHNWPSATQLRILKSMR